MANIFTFESQKVFKSLKKLYTKTLSSFQMLPLPAQRVMLIQSRYQKTTLSLFMSDQNSVTLKLVGFQYSFTFEKRRIN